MHRGFSGQIMNLQRLHTHRQWVDQSQASNEDGLVDYLGTATITTEEAAMLTKTLLPFQQNSTEDAKVTNNGRKVY